MAKDTTGRLHVTVKSGGKRKLSSKLWLERQLNDPYVAQAKRDGYRSRAAYKLIEIDDKVSFPQARHRGGRSRRRPRRLEPDRRQDASARSTARARWWRSISWRCRKSPASILRSSTSCRGGASKS
jgi:hypothetical protein